MTCLRYTCIELWYESRSYIVTTVTSSETNTSIFVVYHDHRLNLTSEQESCQLLTVPENPVYRRLYSNSGSSSKSCGILLDILTRNSKDERPDLVSPVLLGDAFDP